MRTINPILKAACQSGQGLPIASAVVTPMTSTPHDPQSFSVIKYNQQGDELTALLRGASIPYYGKIVIARGYQVGSTEYTEPLPVFYIQKVVEVESGDFEIRANAMPPAKFETDTTGTSIANAIAYFAGLSKITVTCPESGDPNSIFDATSIAAGSDIYHNTKQALYGIGAWPYIRYYKTETGFMALATPPSAVNVTDIEIIQKKKTRSYDFFCLTYVSAIGGNFPITAYLDETNRELPGGLIIYFDPTGRVPDFQTTMAQYYNELEDAHTMFLLADMSLEDGDVFAYDGYYWRIESISEQFGQSGFDQTLFCLPIGAIPVPYYILLESGDFLLLESGDKILME